MQETKRPKVERTAKRSDLRRKKLPTETKRKDGKRQKTLDNRLLGAISSSKTTEAERLLRKGASANAKDKSGMTALMSAASGRRMDVCKLLVESGADVNAKDVTDMTALHYAATMGSIRICAFLILNRADIWAETSVMRKTASSVAESRSEFETQEFLRAVESIWEYLGEDGFRAFASNLKDCVSSP